ncbi:DNA cytosine methyltransferase [Bacillus sp. RC250]
MECERLNSFPDDWTSTGILNRMRYFCMENAIVVGLIKRMARRVHEVD